MSSGWTSLFTRVYLILQRNRIANWQSSMARGSLPRRTTTSLDRWFLRAAERRKTRTSHVQRWNHSVRQANRSSRVGWLTVAGCISLADHLKLIKCWLRATEAVPVCFCCCYFSVRHYRRVLSTPLSRFLRGQTGTKTVLYRPSTKTTVLVRPPNLLPF